MLSRNSFNGRRRWPLHVRCCKKVHVRYLISWWVLVFLKSLLWMLLSSIREVLIFTVIIVARVVAKYCDEHICMCVCVWLCICLSVCEDISGTTHMIFTTFFCAWCLWQWLDAPPAGWWNPKGKGQFWGFPFHWQCIVQYSVWDPYKNSWTNRDGVWDDRLW